MPCSLTAGYAMEINPSKIWWARFSQRKAHSHPQHYQDKAQESFLPYDFLKRNVSLEKMLG